MIQRISNYLRAGYSGLYVVSHEEGRVEEALSSSIQSCNDTRPKNDPHHPPFKLFIWSITEGVLEAKKGTKVGGQEDGVAGLFDWFEKADDFTVVLCRDFHLPVEDRNPFVWRRLRDLLKHGKSKNKTLVVLGCRLTLPPELEKEVVVLDFSLPDVTALGAVLDRLVEDNAIPKNSVDERGPLLSAASGLTLIEAEQAFALSYVETKRISKETVFREKCQAVRKNGLLEVVESKITLDDIGGLENLKHWLVERRDAFGDEAKAFHLPSPRGMLIVGQPGTGKSLAAKACHSVFGVPLIRLDAGKLFGSLVGQSEGNWRAVHATAKAMAPCILWIDEVEGATSGSANSGQTDGGTTDRVVKSILQDMQDNSEGIFYALTANDVDKLPAPLLRRMDEVWNVELPTVGEREAVWRIQISKHKRKPEAFDVQALALKTEGYSGAEIEKLMTQMLYRGFAERREPTLDDGLALIETFSPLSKTMAADIEKRRQRLAGVAKLAGGAVKLSTPKPTRRIAAVGRN
jgi:AAA+ superfamily predicted ATPase